MNKLITKEILDSLNREEWQTARDIVNTKLQGLSSQKVASIIRARLKPDGLIRQRRRRVSGKFYNEYKRK